MSKVYSVMQWKDDESFESQGIFDSEERARAACVNWRYCYMEFVLNEPVQDETVEGNWVYPIARTI